MERYSTPSTQGLGEEPGIITRRQLIEEAAAKEDKLRAIRLKQQLEGFNSYQANAIGATPVNNNILYFIFLLVVITAFIIGYTKLRDNKRKTINVHNVHNV